MVPMNNCGCVDHDGFLFRGLFKCIISKENWALPTEGRGMKGGRKGLRYGERKNDSGRREGEGLDWGPGKKRKARIYVT